MTFRSSQIEARLAELQQACEEHGVRLEIIVHDQSKRETPSPLGFLIRSKKGGRSLLSGWIQRPYEESLASLTERVRERWSHPAARR